MRRRAAACIVLGIAALIWLREPIAQAAVQLMWGGALALAALPVMKRLERRMPAGLAAILSVGALLGAVCAVIALLAPPLIRQTREVTALLPTAFSTVRRWLDSVLPGRQTELYNLLISRAQEAAGTVVWTLISWVAGAAKGIGRWLLAPVFAIYFLRDRKQTVHRLYAVLPSRWRLLGRRLLAEIRRQTGGYLKGQLAVSAAVGTATALGLLVCGVPAWLVLGIAMGILELIPYIGPAAGCVLTALFALPGGMAQTLWALGVVLAVQQLEGMLSAQLLSGAIHLHPVAVLAAVLVGGSAAGVTGVLISIPLVLCVRAAAQILCTE